MRGRGGVAGFAPAFAPGFALGVATTVGVLMLGSSNPADATKTPALSREAFHDALDDVLDRYVEPVNEGEVLSRGLKHILAGLDPHSHYLTASERKRLRRARRGTLGAAVVLRVDARGRRSLEIVSVRPGSPADDAGLKPGDYIAQIGEVGVDEVLSQAQAEVMLGGKVGEQIALQVQRRDRPGLTQVQLELASMRQEMVTASVHKVVGGHVARIRIAAFAAGTGQQVERALAKARRQAGSKGLRGIVLDLRSNPGGQVDEALVVADAFIDDGLLTRTRGRGGRILREERAHAAGTDGQTALVVLQDRHTASAAELLAVALQEHKRAIVVGERSYGKGTVQEIKGLPDGSVLSFTIARYHSPEDRVIDGKGVQPDVERTFDTDDQALAAALDTLGVVERR